MDYPYFTVYSLDQTLSVRRPVQLTIVTPGDTLLGVDEAENGGAAR